MKETILLTDGYKLCHHRMYPEGIELVFSSWIPRSNQHYKEAHEGAVVFGLQYFIKEYLIKQFNEGFFNRPKEEVINEYVNRVKYFTGDTDSKHIEELHDIGYLPIEIKSLPEGDLCPIHVPMYTIQNTNPKFAWLTNYLESLMSCILWMPSTSATTARLFKKRLLEHAKKTGFSDIDFLCHDFSMRGMSGIEACKISGMAHLTSFCGTESVPALNVIEEYYNADPTKELVAGTVPASEHSIECSNAIFNEDGTIDELPYFERLLKQYPEGFLSIVSDGFDFWKIVEEILPKLKDKIMSRNGRIVIRPDSGDPVDIICGYVTNPNMQTKITNDKYYYKYRNNDSKWTECSFGQYYGAYQTLIKLFGFNLTENGYMYPDNHIGLIYGDAITLERQSQIYNRLESMGLAACNLVLGVGSYSYQLKSRDSLGFAMKCSAVRINGELKPIFKKPKTDDGTKNSLKGLVWVTKEDGKYVVHDEATEEQEKCGYLETIFKDGKLLKETSLSEIRERVNSTI